MSEEELKEVREFVKKVEKEGVSIGELLDTTNWLYDLTKEVIKLQKENKELNKKNKRYEKYLKNKDIEHEKVLEELLGE